MLLTNIAFIQNLAAFEIIIIFLFIVLPSICWIKAVITDANSNAISWLLVDIFVAPIGAIRGLLMFLKKV